MNDLPRLLFPTSSEPHTKPWLPEEYILIDGHALPYCVKGGDVEVHFACGKKAMLSDLRKEGHAISAPVRWHGGKG
jgi:hypothetical protein